LSQLSLTLSRDSTDTLSAEDALQYARRATELQPHSIKYWGQYAAAANVLKADELCRNALNKIGQLGAKDADDINTKVWALLMLGDPRQAFGISQDELNILPFDKLEQIKSDSAKRLSSHSGSLPEKSDRPLLFAAASGDYAELYSDNLIASALYLSPGFDIHLHVIDPGPFEPEVQFAKFPRDRLTWTSENIGGKPAKAVYASRRFLLLPELLRKTERTVVCIDIDSICRKDLTPALESLRPFDILIYERPLEIYVQQMVAAGFFAAAPTDAAIAFCDFVASYILHFENASTSRWFVDQLAIISAKAFFAESDRSIQIKPAPPNVLDWSIDGNAEGLIWTAKGHMKQYFSG